MDCTAVIFTPYSTAGKIVDAVLNDIHQLIPSEIVFRRKAELNEEDVEFMYPKLVDESFFHNIVQCLTGGSSEVVVLRGEHIHAVMDGVKGKLPQTNYADNPSGLRSKYRRDDSSFEFVFHTTDSNDETDLICTRLFGAKYKSLVAEVDD